jgi:hypothetical protein
MLAVRRSGTGETSRYLAPVAVPSWRALRADILSFVFSISLTLIRAPKLWPKVAMTKMRKEAFTARLLLSLKATSRAEQRLVPDPGKSF